jgi:cytochrome P450
MSALSQMFFFTEHQIISVCADLFTAGTETTASTVGFALRYLIKYPEIQDKVREELHRVIGKERPPSMEDVPEYN